VAEVFRLSAGPSEEPMLDGQRRTKKRRLVINILLAKEAKAAWIGSTRRVTWRYNSISRDTIRLQFLL
jgi:hypothetical protein